MIRPRIPALALALAVSALPGCVTISRESELSKLEARLRTEERERQRQLGELETKLAEVERKYTYLEGYIAGLAATRGSGAAAAPGPLPAASAMPPPPTAPAAPAGRDPARFGGTYRQALVSDPPRLDPALIEDTTSHRVGAQLLEGLVEFDDALEVVPCIAESWTLSEDRTTYTFRIRPGVKFHHGRVVEAEDFAYSFRRILDPKTASPRVWLFDQVLGFDSFQALRAVGGVLKRIVQGEAAAAGELAPFRAALDRVTPEALARAGHPDPAGVAALARETAAFIDGGAPAAAAAGLEARLAGLSHLDFLKRGFEVPDPRTFVIRLSQPFAPFIAVLAMANCAVVPREKVEELGDRFSFQPVGAGPFRFVEWVHDVSLTLEAFPEYFQGRPYLDRLTFRIIPDENTKLTEFEVGNLDSVNRVPDEKYEQVKNDPAFPGVLVEKPILHVFYLGLNVEKKPFDDARVRRAFNHAVDRKTILEKVRKGRGTLAKGPLPPGLPGYDPDLAGYDYAPERAVALLKEAGFDPPSKLGKVGFWFNTSTGSDVNAKIAEVVQENLRRIGVDLEFHPVEWGTYLDMVNRGDPQMLRMAWVGDYPDADNFLYILFHSSVIGQSNTARYRDDGVDRMLEKARVSADSAERIALYREAQRKIVADAPWIPIFHMTEPFLAKPWVKGAVLNGRGADAIRMKTVWIDKAIQAREAGGR